VLPIILIALVPIFFVLLLGYLAGRLKRLDNTRVGELNVLVMEFALPCALFIGTLHTPRAVLIDRWPVVIVLGLGMVIIYALTYFLQRRVFGLDTQEAAVQTLTTSLPNYASCGLPLVAAVFGPSQTVLVAISIACGATIVSPLTLTLLELGKPGGSACGASGGVLVGRAMRHAFTRPIVAAPICGIILSLLGLSLPPLADKLLGSSLDLLGRTAGGVALFLTGMILSAQAFEWSANVLSSVLLKNIVHPLVAFGIVRWLRMPPDIGRAAIIISAIPSGFFGVLFGLRYGVQSRAAGSTLIASSVLGALTLAAAIYLTGR
jgi:malonate transporter